MRPPELSQKSERSVRQTETSDTRGIWIRMSLHPVLLVRQWTQVLRVIYFAIGVSKRTNWCCQTTSWKSLRIRWQSPTFVSG